METDNFRITYESAGEYTNGNEFLHPKDGYVYFQFTFKFENISDTDQAISTMIDWECYADNSKVDQTWIVDDNGLDGKLSSGRESEGSVDLEGPEDAESVELEDDINLWQSDNKTFVAKRQFKGREICPLFFLLVSLLNVVAHGGLRRPGW